MHELSKDSKVLIILMGSLGDVIRAVSLLKPIKKSLPSSNITWLVDSRWKGLLADHPSIDHLLVLPRPFNIGKFLELRKQLKDESYDVVLDLQRILKSGLLSSMAKSKRKICFNTKNSKEFNYLFNNEQINFFPDDYLKIHHYHEFIKHLGIETKEPYEFGLEYLNQYAPESLSVNGQASKIALVLESSWESKDWFLPGYMKLVELILNGGQQEVVLLGTKKKLAWAKQIEEHFSVDRITNLVDQTNLVELAGAISKMKLVIGPDSGPGHLAAAMKIPYISLFGPTSVDRVAPYQQAENSIKVPLVCRPCNLRKCPGLNKICMRMISPERVYARIEGLIN